MQKFISVQDVDDLPTLLNLARKFKAQPRMQAKLGEGKSLINLFFNPSLRTRLSTEKAGRNLGLDVVT
ncbi:MAG: acetylornithine carbamoyltransferase, partial [Lewinella sp.]|nr:acetylornithine carbamoyltransferase [Lewinella sp.]